MKPKVKKSVSERPAKASSAIGNPCFTCGLIFARKEEFIEHLERYHQTKSQEGRKDHFRCVECDQTFAVEEEKGFKEHLRIHDLRKIYGALRRSDRKRIQPLVVQAPPPVTEQPTTMAITAKAETTKEEKPAPAAPEPTPPPPPPKNKGGRPRSKSVFTTNSTIGKVLEATAKIASQADATPIDLTTTSRKRRRVSNETPSQAIISTTVATPSSAASTQPPTPATPQASSENPATPSEPKSVPPPSPAIIPSLPLPPPLPTLANVQKQVLPALNSACPNCNQNLGKPWHLVDHMIQMHEAQLLRLHRTLKKPDGTSGPTTMSQMFTDRQCPFCQLTYADMQTSLLHVVRTHRSRLFECPDNGECVLTCELMCAIGPEAAPKKFTISVKVKRKTNE